MLVEDLKASVASASTRAGFERMAALLKDDATVEANGRQIAEGLAELAAAILLQAHAPAEVAEAFIANVSAPRHNDLWRLYGERALDRRAGVGEGRLIATGVRL